MLFSLSEPTHFPSERSPNFQDLLSSVPINRAAENCLTLWLTPQSKRPRGGCEHRPPQHSCDSGKISFAAEHGRICITRSSVTWHRTARGSAVRKAFPGSTILRTCRYWLGKNTRNGSKRSTTGPASWHRCQEAASGTEKKTMNTSCPEQMTFVGLTCFLRHL